MLEVRNGAGETLGVLFDRYHAPLYNFYSKLTGDRTLSDDLGAGSFFLRILATYRQSYQPGTPISSADLLRLRGMRAWIITGKTPRHTLRFEPEMGGALVMPKDSAQQTEEAELLHRALMQMPDEKEKF